MDDDINIARKLGEAAFGSADNDTPNAASILASYRAPSFPPHPASPAAAHSLSRTQQQQRSLLGQVAADTTLATVNGSKGTASASSSAAQQQGLATAPNVLATQASSTAMASGHALPVKMSEMVKNLLDKALAERNDSTTSTIAAALAGPTHPVAASAAATYVANETLQRVAASAVAALRATEKGHSDALNIHRQQRENEGQGAGTSNAANHGLGVGAGVTAVVSQPAAAISAGARLLGEEDVVVVVLPGGDKPVAVATRGHAASSNVAASTLNPNENATRQASGSVGAASESAATCPVGQVDVNEDAMRELGRFAEDFKQKRMQLGYTQTKVGKALAEIHGSMFSQTTVCRFENMQLSLANASKLRPILEAWLASVTPQTGAAKAVGLKAGNAPAADGSLGTGDSAPSTQTSHSSESSSSSAVIATPQPAFPAHPSAIAASASLGSPTTQAASPPKPRTPRSTNNRATISNPARLQLEEMYKNYPKPTPKQMEDLAKDLGLPKPTVRVWFCNRRQRENRMRSIMSRSEIDD